MDAIKSRQTVYLGDNTDKNNNIIVCPYCGKELYFSRDHSSDPKAISSCEHFTSILMEANYDNELRYEQYARFKEV